MDFVKVLSFLISLKSRSLRYTFLVTLSYCSIGTGSIWQFLSRALSIKWIIASVEGHEKGEPHLHILFQLKEGLNKNKAVKIIRLIIEQANIQSGRGIDIQGVKNLNRSINYIRKECGIEGLDLFGHISLFEVYKLGGHELAGIVRTITPFERLIEWVKHNVYNESFYLKNKNKVFHMWSYSRTLIPQITLLAKLTQYINTHGVSLISLESRSFLSRKNNLLLVPWIIIVLKLLLKTCFLRGEGWKTTNLYIAGPPNCGKTSFFNKLSSVFNYPIYFVGGRPNDLSLYENNQTIVFDDILGKGVTWEIGSLLKLFGGEGLKADQKYGRIFEISPSTTCVLLSNFHRLFVHNDAISARLCWVNLSGFSRGRAPNWFIMSDQEFFTLVFTLYLELEVLLSKPYSFTSEVVIDELNWLKSVMDLPEIKEDHSLKSLRSVYDYCYKKNSFLSHWLIRVMIYLTNIPKGEVINRYNEYLYRCKAVIREEGWI